MNHSRKTKCSIVLLFLAAAVSLPAVAQVPCSPTPASPAPGGASVPCLAPLTGQERLKDYLRATLGPGALLGPAAGAGIAQARNHPSAWEQGMAGYGRRYADRFGKRLVDHSIRLAVESALGEDSRYLQSPRRETWSRIQHAVRQSFIARTADGRETFAVGRVAGRVGGGFISRTWHPEGHDDFEDGLRSSGISFGFDIASNVFREFWPDIRKRLHLPF